MLHLHRQPGWLSWCPRGCPPYIGPSDNKPGADPRLWPLSALAVSLLQRLEEVLALQRVENARVDVIGNVDAAARRKLRKNIRGSGAGRLDRRRRQLREIVVADVEDLGVARVGLSGQHLASAGAVADREIVSLGGRAQKAH